MINANTNSLGGHALYCIGWDNDLVYSDGLGTHTGAFICKNSWNTFTLIPFDNSFSSLKTSDYAVIFIYMKSVAIFLFLKSFL